MARIKNGKWLKWLEYDTIKTYLNGSIGSKSSEIGSNVTLEQKINDVNLTNYLKGVEVFLKEYSDKFNEPYELVDTFNEIRADKKKVNEYKQHIEAYIVWLNNERGLSAKTSQNYQAHLRGFLTWNNINLKFRNYDVTSETAKMYDKFSIGFDELKQIGDKVISYVTDFDLKLLLQWLRISGLGSKELLILKFRDLRYKDYSKTFVRIDKTRKKTGVKFTTFIYGEVKEQVQKYLNLNKDKDDDDYLFGEPNQTYINMEKRFRRSYNRVITQEFPQYKDTEKSIFTMHKYRHIIQTICVMLRIPKHHENIFVAHKQTQGLERDYVLEKDLLESFKLIQEELFEIRESSKREEIEKEIIENITQALLNRGKRKSIFNKFELASEDDRKDFSNEIRMNFVVEKLIQSAKEELLKDPNFIQVIVTSPDFIKAVKGMLPIF